MSTYTKHNSTDVLKLSCECSMTAMVLVNSHFLKLNMCLRGQNRIRDPYSFEGKTLVLHIFEDPRFFLVRTNG